MNQQTNRPVPELLAPVGGWKQLEAAVNHGADAVYMGGSLFHARINAENFTDESLAAAIDFAHESGVKVYITFNTLLKDSELERAFRYACRLYEMGADALIVQDAGLARLVHNYLPDFPLHLSTQGTVYNPQALDLVKQLGFRRVVPARELSLEELGPMAEGCHERGMDIEVFVHGALCMCYSGQCQMSRAFGGGARSGNRGLCAQPCRLLYTDDKGRKGYFLSPKDLCALELIPQLIEAGVDSFKIEGRLKSAEYVAVTTAVYRKYLDLYAQMTADGSAEAHAAMTADEWKTLIDPADMEKLLRIFNRGGFTHGYLEGNPGDDILSGESPKNQGIYIGKVRGVADVRSKGRDKELIDIAGDVSFGDGVEVRRRLEDADETGAAVVTGSTVVTYVQKQGNDVLRIGDFDRGIRAGDSVYKVTDKALQEEVLAAPAKRLPVRMTFKAHVGDDPTLAMELADAGYGVGPVYVRGDFAVEKAVNRPLTEDRIAAQLIKLGGTGFRAGEENLIIETDPDIAVPASVMNGMRRRAAEKLKEALRNEVRTRRAPLTGEALDGIIAAEKLGDDAEVKRVEALAAGSSSAEEHIPALLNVTKGAADKYIRENFDSLVSDVRDSGILVGNLGWAKQFIDAGVTVYGDYGLNAFNSQSIRAYEELGIRMRRLSHEKNSGGQIPLMITEHPFKTDYLVDRKGVKHKIIKKSDDKYLIF